ncbi:ATP synthase subunit I [Metaclostridioides mangenotii]|uniref:Ca2+/H+ antiporter (TMEM165/GDT1 family) n=1 Tax=Metaclostridioides mangenotii TaxID=1540 RepID=A0ABS4EEP0_9FIRM|nr:ATP synthase subunit I [Clostridioides mangenotii]MBP1856326.1 putative Ca2+/H+ antiporter (TMEM165/GDT1 family) [Clostridioides mangenotii]
MDVKLLEKVREITKGIVIYDIVITVLSVVVSLFSKQLFLGLIFGSLIAILSFRLSAIKIDRTFGGGSSKKPQLLILSGFGTRMAIYAIVLVASARAPHLNVFGTALGLTSTQFVILTKNLFIDKIKERRSKA